MIIWNGPHRVDTEDPATHSIGVLYKADGNAVPVYRDNIAEAYGDAVGAPPAMPMDMLGMGELKPVYGQIATNTFGQQRTAQVIASYVYDPGPHDYNQDLVAAYAAAVTAWNAHAEAMKSVVDVILATMPKG